MPDIIHNGGVRMKTYLFAFVRGQMGKNFRKKLLLSVSMILRRKMNWESYY